MPKIIDHAAAITELRDHLAEIPLEHLPEAARAAVTSALRSADAFSNMDAATFALRTQPTISVDQYSTVLGIDRSTAYAAAKCGDLPTITVGRRLRVPSAVVLRQLGLSEVA